MNSFGFNVSMPENIEPLSRSVIEILARYTPFAWPILLTHCKRIQADPAAISHSQLAQLVNVLGDAAGRYTSPATQEAVKVALQALAQPPR